MAWRRPRGKGALTNSAMPYLPVELVATQILLRLPIESLLRFICVCKAWRDMIADDSFHRAHLRLQNMSLLIAPQIENSDMEMTTVGLYRWEESQKDGATLLHSMADYGSFCPYKEVVHDLAHCDGLVLVPADATTRVLNPATRHALTLPWSPHIARLHGDISMGFKGHQAFGIGHEYKFARSFYNSLEYKFAVGYRYNLGMEVYTIGEADQQWRETSTPPPYPIMPGRTATFFKGSLFWTVDEPILRDTAVTPGFIRFRLEDESFDVTPPPPCRYEIDYAA